MTLLQHLQKLPPVVVRLCAQTDGRLASATELAARSGLSVVWICWLSPMREWPKGVALGRVSKFYEACGVDPIQHGKTLAFVRRGLMSKNGFAHIQALKKADRKHRQLYPYAISLMQGTRAWRTSRKKQAPTEAMPHT